MGIDLGTQSVRCLVVDAAGRVLGSGSASLPEVRDGVEHTQHPDDWWEAVVAAVRGAGEEMAAAGTTLGGVRAVAVDATSGTVALLDRDGAATGPALMYDDARATEETERAADAARELGLEGPTAALARVMWLLGRDDVPAGAQVAHQADVITRRLVGAPVPTDTSTALKSGVDPVAVAWPGDLLAAVGVDRAALPEVVLPGTVLGTVGAAAAGETGLPRDAEVVAGMTDGCASQLGAGVVGVGDWNSVLGTTLVLKGVTADRLVDPAGVVYSHRSSDGSWLPGGASSVGAGLVSRDFGGADLDALSRAAGRLLPTPVLRYPLVSPGERFPFRAPDARDLVLGTPADDAEAFASLLQGAAYAERLCLDLLESLGAPLDGDVVVTGGASANDVWTQLRADVLGRPLHRVRLAEPALGMAVLARGRGDGLRAAAAEMVERVAVVEPRRDTAGRPAEDHVVGYRRLVDELEGRGWLPADLAAHARRRSEG